jgi:hypothetical protein
MVSITQQMLQQQRKQRAIAQAQQRQQAQALPMNWQEYDQSTTEGQVLSTRQQIQQARTPLEQFKREQLYPKTRARAFTARKDRAQLVETGRQVETQLGEVAGQEQVFEREVATKAPEYATQVYKQQAAQEARANIQKRVDSLNARIQSQLDYIKRVEEDRRQERDSDRRARLREDIQRAEDNISESKAELNEYLKGLGSDENTLIKQHFSGYLQQKAQYEADYRAARNQQQNDFRRYRDSPQFKDIAKQLNLPSNATLTQFNIAVDKFNNDVAYKTQLLKFAEQKGGVQFLNPAQQKALGVDENLKNIRSFEQQNPGEKVVLDKMGNAIAIQSSVFKQSMPIEVYNQKMASQGMSIPAPLQKISSQQPTIKYGSWYQNLDAKLGGRLPGGLTPQQVAKDKASAMDLFTNRPTGVSYGPGEFGSTRSFVVSFPTQKEEDLKRIDALTKDGIDRPSVNISSMVSNGNLSSGTNLSSIPNFTPTQKEVKLSSLFKEYFRGGAGLLGEKRMEGFDTLYSQYKQQNQNKPSLFAGFIKATAVQDAMKNLRQQGWTEKEIDDFSPIFKEAKKGLGDKDIKRFVVTSTISSAAPFIPLSTSAALFLNVSNFEKLLEPTASNETKLASVKQIALALGASYLSSAALGAAAGFTKDAAQVAGYRILAGVLGKAGSTGSAVIRNIAGLSLVGAGKAAQFGIQTYFKKQMIETAITFAQSARQKDYEKASLSAAEFIGGYGVPGTRIRGGFATGMKVGSKVFSLGGLLTGKLVSARPELYKGQVTIKRSPSAIQTDILTGGKPVVGYRLGPVETGLKYTPRIDKYLSAKIKDPTKGTFFRYEETIGVKGKRIQPALSTPAFVQPPKYTEMFSANFQAAKGNKFRKLIDAFAKTPVMTDVLGVMKIPTKINPKYETLRNKAIKEFATTGKLSASTKKELLKADLKISDKLRELEFAEEQEAVLRKVSKLKNVKFGFTRGADGRIIPVLYEKGTLKPKLSVLKQKKIITEQDAKFIQRQYNMWQKFGKDYVLPKEHSVRHSKDVMENVKKVVNAYPEYHPYLKKKYGSLDKAIKELQKGAKFHDIGKTSETSIEFGTPHGQKFYDVYKAKLLPKEAQNIKEGIARAIKTHETIAGTKAGRYTLKYQFSNILGLNTPEQKILATADRLDLMRYASLRDKVDPKRLPLGDALTRLGFRAPPVKKESVTRKFVSFVSSAIPIKQKVKAPARVEYYNPLVGAQARYTPSKKQETQYNPLVPSKSYTYKAPKQQYGAPYKKIDSYFRPSGYKTPYKEPTRYKEPEYKQPSYKQPRYDQPRYAPPKYPKSTTYKQPYPKPQPTPQQGVNLLISPRPEKPKPQPKPQIRRPTRYQLTPTITQKIYMVRRKSKARRITGFEALRI